MIEVLNEEINKFLSSHPSVEKNTLSQIKKRYSSTVTDELSKGHLTTNVCMIAASQLKINPKELANELQKELSDSKKFKKVEAAGPGFINITLKRENFISTIDNVNAQSINFGSSNSGKNQSIQIEFVSANPTGPLHVGHGRGAAYGDAIGRILKSSGYEVQKEYYINDAGRQIDILTASVFTRIFEEDLSGYFPKNAYKGSYIFDIAELFKKKYRPNTLIDYKSLIHNLPQEEEKEIDELILRIKKTENDMWSKVKSLALSEVLQTIRSDLESFNVSFDNWFSESSLGDLSDKKSKISTAITSLKNKDLAYEENGAIWLNTSHAGDDKNRVLIRDDGRATYFASDVAYHKDKIDRGFDKLINVWGADHHGYIKRIEASINGLGFDEEKLDVQLVQFANLFKDGKKIKMSTRSGEFFSLADLIDEIGTDAARFYYLSKQADQHLDFDLDLAKADSKENMFYYIQYAHARICSLHKKYTDENSSLPKKAVSITSGSYKNCDKLIHEMSKYPTVVSRASSSLQPHLIIFYLKDFAHCFHSFYNDNQVLTESKENVEAIIYCLDAAKTILSNGLALLGIKPIEKM
ncbi:arginine--tRNA ligase [Gammaproteobacteria bacterium]|jgi:arginyl-tRNA synthetase|nr:arginine--tRNA ligase [Gammaproteobacteria bacterium]MDC0405622.1 arginine--tRNA ligase [Gammaproteobacteria bacterium]MDC0421207.1 arginine--tRNA ligase [Gammaproteobacteria bacterium]MDC0536081.1 arginine--tRNA ligase [Gammaproteobacteria bacterium]MDC1149140.1 arginine--tRNA ligase [Gammaproteobacteria bacterium]|tara:strand:+ start:2980 stop:4725 length:1746 start_codon:yes stop_codon:yes gene_type:complete